MRIHHLLFIALLAATAALHAKDKKPKPTPKEPQDEIQVLAHISATSGPVRRFLTTQHFSSQYLYVEHDAGKGVTLVDVTKASRPSVLAEISYPAGQGDSLVVVTGTAALVANESVAQTTTPPPHSLRIMDFSDPLHPRVAREFTGVTAISRDDARRLIFVANAEGVWILHQNLAQDPEVEKAYAHHVLYDH
jgi:hypothetical protein